MTEYILLASLGLIIGAIISKYENKGNHPYEIYER